MTFPLTAATRCPVELINWTFFNSSCHTESQNLENYSIAIEEKYVHSNYYNDSAFLINPRSFHN
jgi:hypothetical protein